MPDALLKMVENEIDRIIADLGIVTPKKGYLIYLRVHKFKLEGQEALLGYNWAEEKLTLHLLNLSPHESFYKSAKKRRTADLTFIG